jgi:3-oxoadipate enol-lactonase
MFLESDVGSVYYEVHGPEDAPAVMFLHGVAMDHRTFDHQVAALSDQYRVIVWDMPYHGRSSGIDKGLSFARTAADLAMEILDLLAIQKAVMAGLSLGSFVVQHAAHAYPDRVMATVHTSGSSLHPKYPAFLKLIMPFTYLVVKMLPSQTVNRSFAVHKALTEDTIAYLMETTAQTGKDAIIHLTNEMTRDLVQGLPEPSTQPSLIVYGDHDLRFIRHMAILWHERQPNSRLVEVPNAHHILNQDNPAYFNRCLLGFLREVTTP